MIYCNIVTVYLLDVVIYKNLRRPQNQSNYTLNAAGGSRMMLVVVVPYLSCSLFISKSQGLSRSYYFTQTPPSFFLPVQALIIRWVSSDHVWNKHSYIIEVKHWNRYPKLHWENRNMHIAVTVLNHYMTHFGILAKERLGDYKWEQHELWFDKEYNKIIRWRRQAKLQLGQAPRQNSDDTHNLNSARYETRILSRNKEGNIWKVKLMSLKYTVRTRILDIWTG